jgi:hypothetical protein
MAGHGGAKERLACTPYDASASDKELTHGEDDMSRDSSIAELAYRLWIERGRPHGSAEADWLEAERRLSPQHAEDSSSRDSFPASDPPATHQPDIVPSNAAEKWRAADNKASSKTLRAAKRR